jgi:Holliday junction DNA helicase, RuvA subunit
MISYLKGQIAEIDMNTIILEVQNIGYEIFMPVRAIEALPKVGSEVKIHTYFNVREDAMQLYGFLNKDELNIFKLLITVNGVGPKAGLGILSTLSPDDIRFAVLGDDAVTIAKAPGIGKKTASKLVLELKDKFDFEEVVNQRFENTQTEDIASIGNMDSMTEAVQALVALGYSNTDALKAIKKIEITEDMDVEVILKLALKNFSFL